MPPKRKSNQGVPAVSKKPKSVKKKPLTVLKKNTLTVEEWFNKYKDADMPDLITPDGCQAFFSDMGVSLESILTLIIGWKMNAGSLGFFTREEWEHGMNALNVENEDQLRSKLSELEALMEEDADLFRQLYLYTFPYAKSTGQKSMDVETAIALWQLLLLRKYPIMTSFIRFIQEVNPVKVINKDQWTSLLDFCRTVPEDLSHYDSTSSWPVLFDDYVEWRKTV